MSTTPPSLRLRLSVMMFLQYAIWGAWLPILWAFLADYRGFEDSQIKSMFAVGAIGAILAPFIAGQLADRFFATEKFLGVCHLLGAALVWQLASIESYTSFLVFSLVYSLLYCPTMPLSNSLAFHHLVDRDKDFGRVRRWGTVGWIVVGIAVGQWLLHHYTPEEATPAQVAAAQAMGRGDAFKLSAILGVIMGLYCFTLPHTPPTKGEQENATVEALSEIKKQPLITLFLISIPIACIHQFYFVHTAGFLSVFQNEAAGAINQIFGVGGGGLMTIGQMSEIVVLSLIPFIAKTVSRKSLLLIGCLAYAARMALFAFVDYVPLDPIQTLCIGVGLHGVCFGCFMFIAFMIVDEECSPDVRATAQSLYNLVSVGVGVLVGSLLAGTIAEVAAHGAKKLDYSVREQTTTLFSIPMWASLACFLLVLVFYPSKSRAEVRA